MGKYSKPRIHKKWDKTEVVMAVLALMLLAVTVLLGVHLWGGDGSNFHDLTVHVSDGGVQIGQFCASGTDENRAQWITDPDSIDFSRPGDQFVTLKYGSKEETVILTIVDDLPPVLQLQDVVLTAGQQLVAEDFIARVTDHSQVQASFAEEYTIPADYSDLTVTVKVVDAAGNETIGTAVASFLWVRESVVLEMGRTLTSADILYSTEQDGSAISQEELDRLNSAEPGEYELTLKSGNRTAVCKITVQDTRGPDLQVQEHYILLGGKAELKDFLLDAQDPSGVKDLRLMETPDNQTLGDQKITVVAEDNRGNISTTETVLHVIFDDIPPVINGAKAVLNVQRNSTPDYLYGIKAVDHMTGEAVVHYDDSKVDLSREGTYYVTYTATDRVGNTAREIRQVNVIHNQEDTKALVASIADKLSDDPEKIRDYVQLNVHHSWDWGGEDPVWSGFQNMHGNGYVHAMCLKALYDYKGITSQLIWTTDKNHYWLVVQMSDGSWRHMDATPLSQHMLYSKMTDAQRLSTLEGGDWDHSAWPACE